MPNTFEIDNPRIGNLIDFNDETPIQVVVLTRLSDDITLTVPWDQDESPYARWFLRDHVVPSSGMRLAEGSPTQLLFQDVHGLVLMVGCFARGYSASAFGPGQGTIHARYAVMGADGRVSYEAIHGLQSSIRGLRRWLGLSSWSQKVTTPDTRIILESITHDSIAFGSWEGFELKVVPSAGWSNNEADDAGQRLSDTVRFVSTTEKPEAWDRHLSFHRGLRDLLALSAWRRLGIETTSALRRDDERIVSPGRDAKYLWRQVVAARHDPSDETSLRESPHLVRYEDLGPSGIAKWNRLRFDFGRALKPVISSLGLREVSPETLLAHTIPGLEALAYGLELRDGVAERTAAFRRNPKRFDRILQEVGDCLPFDGQLWKVRTLAAYNGVKHANQPETDDLDALNAWRESVMIVRAWVALELGVPRVELKKRLAEDPQRHAWVRVGQEAT